MIAEGGTVCNNKRGFTLIEVLIAIVILLVGMLALLYAVSLFTSTNVQNVMRDEAVKIGERQMSLIKNTPFSSIPVGSAVSIGLTGSPVESGIRSTTVKYTVTTNTAYLSASNDSLSVQVIVSWQYKAQTARHSVTSMIARGI
jgi:type IV pilus assembly protein PilV